MLEISNKGYEVRRWDDKITENLSYWFGGNFSNNKNELKSLKMLLLRQLMVVI
jgi:hypothetical protein